jgi:glucose/mannose transport system substrate-binding protein
MKRWVCLAIAVLLLALPASIFASGTPEKSTGQKLEIFSWWTAGGEAEGLAGMYKIFQAKYPGIEIINATVAGGAGSNAQAVLQTRMQGGNPPDSFQVHAGHELLDNWVAAGKMEPITFILRENNWLDKYPRGVIDIISYKGEVYSIPVNIHRSNVLWYNKKLFADNNLKVPVTIADFLAACDVLAAKGITPLALGDNGIWASTHLLENVLLGTLGPEKYKGLWTGATAWDGAEVKEGLANFTKFMKFVNTDHAALGWDQAAQYIIDGKCAMTVMGDWAEGFFKQKGWTPNNQFGWAASPGTAGSFNMLSDSFGLPKGAKNRDAAIKWLTVCASKEGQDMFNPLKGSIPSRTDGNKSLYDAYLSSAMTDFGKDAIVPSCAHGAAAAPGWSTKINDIMTIFVSDLDVARAASSFAAAAKSYIK